MKDIEYYFPNKEMTAFQLCKNLKRIISQTYNEKNITDNKPFWKTVKPFLSKKNHLSKRINPTEEENNSLLTNCEVVKELNNLFPNAAKNLNISDYENCDSLAENIDDPTLKATVKWRNHPSILAIASEYKNRANDLTKIKMLMSRRPFRRVTFPLKLSRQRRISLQKQFFFILINH